ncbi:MAG: hypothetical protein VX185_05535 [Pseudomonadota bacterium]|nr:hypothetical protein [Pseudomonadota bacterium]
MSLSRLVGLGLLVAPASLMAQEAQESHECVVSQLEEGLTWPEGTEITDVDINVDPIFGDPDSGAFPWLYHLANTLHISTRDSVVERDLLFKEGDKLDPLRLQETERLLRSRRYYSQAKVTLDENCVDGAKVNVDVHDVWTLEPHVEFDKSGTESTYGYGFEETNLFGFGKTLLFSKYSNDQREGHLIKYHDPNTGFYRSTLTLLAADNDDGHAYSGSLIKPFESLESTWSAGLNGYDVRQQRYLYDASVEYDRFGESDNFAEGFIGWRLGDVVDNSVTRLFVGASFRNQFYYPLGITQFDTSVPEHQHGTTYWAELQWLKHDYKEMVNLEAMNRIEDINFGLVSNFRLGFYKAQTGSVDTGIRAQGGLSKYFQLSDNQFIQASLSSTGLFDGGTLYDAATAGRIAYFHKQKIAGENAQFFAEYKEASLVRPFGHHYLELGPTQGARGYEARYQTGEHRQVITLEERWYGQHEWFSLFYLGAALFYDAAHVWGDSPVDLSQEGWLHSAGFGFRIMTNRLGGREGGGVSVLHIDFAGPVGPDRPVDSGQVLVTVKQGF